MIICTCPALAFVSLFAPFQQSLFTIEKILSKIHFQINFRIVPRLKIVVCFSFYRQYLQIFSFSHLVKAILSSYWYAKIPFSIHSIIFTSNAPTFFFYSILYFLAHCQTTFWMSLISKTRWFIFFFFFKYFTWCLILWRFSRLLFK